MPFATASVLTDVPARLDRLPWSAWHWRVVIALGITWVLDGLEVTIVGSVAGVLVEPGTLHLTDGEIGATASAYLAGAIAGALFFGWLTDRLGRKKLFLVTLTLYLVATVCSGLAWNFASFAFFRALTGAGIGGEGAAINSAIDELLPARVRGRADLAINGTYWLGTILGSLSTLVLLDPAIVSHRIGWRLCFLLGGILGSGILLVRRHIPESPRWLLRHNRSPEADEIVATIEREVEKSTGRPLAPVTAKIRVESHGAVGFSTIARVILHGHRRRSILGFVLMVSQAFVYNAIFFTYARVLGRFYGVSADHVGRYLIPFAAGNLLGPLLLGHLFDTIGRRVMIATTYAISGILLAVTGWLFALGSLTAVTQTALWSAMFFVASTAASSAYLTVSELFPVELRGMAIALFYAVGTATGGLAAPAIFGRLVESGNRDSLAHGYLFGAALMVFAAGVAAVLGVSAEGRSLESLQPETSGE